jgi:hypothetical protein
VLDLPSLQALPRWRSTSWRQDQRATELCRECSGIRAVCKAPADKFLLATTLPAPAPALYAARLVEGFEYVECPTKPARR